MTRRVEHRINYAMHVARDVRTDGSGNGQLSVDAVSAVPEDHLAAEFRYPLLLVLAWKLGAITNGALGTRHIS